MFRSALSTVLFVMLAASCCADGPGLRGAAPLEEPSAAEQGGLSENDPRHTDCGCHDGVCQCTRKVAEGEEHSEHQRKLEEALLNSTQVLDAWWRSQKDLWQGEPALFRMLHCSCTVAPGAEVCFCELEPRKGDLPDDEHEHEQHEAEDNETLANGSAVEVPRAEQLRNATEHSMSLCLPGALGWGGRHWGYGGWRYGGWRRHGWGVHCGRAGWGGCGCHWAGCRCGHVHYGGCRGW
jgi:hypothetical protein